MKKNVALVLAGLAIGCGAGAAVTPGATAQGYPPATGYPPGQGYPAAPPAAQAPAAGSRWQQFCEQAGSVQEASSMAAARGAEGFELAAMYNGVLCFKRPILAGGAPLPAQGVPSGFPGY
jgi:hypothetical protein